MEETSALSDALSFLSLGLSVVLLGGGVSLVEQQSQRRGA